MDDENVSLSEQEEDAEALRKAALKDLKGKISFMRRIHNFSMNHA